MDSNVLKSLEKFIMPEPMSGCWLWIGATNKGGYGELRRNKTKDRAHRFYYKAYKGDIPPGLCVLHRCDVRCCVNPEHLFLGTFKDNHDDMDAKKRRFVPHGDKCGNAKLTTEAVLEVRKSTESPEALALKFNVIPKTIKNILDGISWKTTK